MDNNTMKRCKQGMTLVEILIVVAIVAMLSVLLVPAVDSAIENRKNAQAASKIRLLIAAFEMYASENGGYPGDVGRGVVPVGMSDYFSSLNIDWFTQATPLGGNWDWGYNQMGWTATMSIASPKASRDQLLEFDKMMDDGVGDLSAGRFRQESTGNRDHYYYIIKQ